MIATIQLPLWSLGLAWLAICWLATVVEDRRERRRQAQLKARVVRVAKTVDDWARDGDWAA